MEMPRVATVYGGGFDDKTTIEYLDAVMIGKVLVEHGYQVKNGGYRGIMEAVSKGVQEAGGDAVGITLQAYSNGKGNEFLSFTAVAPSLYKRLESLIELSNLFVVCRGGTGTLAELFLTLDIVRKMEIKPRIVCVDHRYASVFDAAHELIPTKELEMVDFVDGYQGLERFLTYNKL